MPPIFIRAFLLSLILAPISAGSMRAQSPPAPAEDPQKAQEERIRKLEEEVQALKAAQATPKSEPAQLGGAGGSAWARLKGADATATRARIRTASENRRRTETDGHIGSMASLFNSIREFPKLATDPVGSASIG